MPFSLSLSSYLLNASACFDREASSVAQVISFTILAVCLSFTKQKQTKKNLLKLQKTAQFIMKPLHLVLKHSCPKIITAYQVVKVRLKWYKIDSNDKW